MIAPRVEKTTGSKRLACNYCRQKKIRCMFTWSTSYSLLMQRTQVTVANHAQIVSTTAKHVSQRLNDALASPSYLLTSTVGFKGSRACFRQ